MSNDMLLYALARTGKDEPPREAPIPPDGPNPRTVRRPRGEGYEPKRSKRSAVSEPQLSRGLPELHAGLAAIFGDELDTDSFKDFTCLLRVEHTRKPALILETSYCHEAYAYSHGEPVTRPAQEFAGRA
jgi:hypothetical protein